MKVCPALSNISTCMRSTASSIGKALFDKRTYGTALVVSGVALFVFAFVTAPPITAAPFFSLSGIIWVYSIPAGRKLDFLVMCIEELAALSLVTMGCAVLLGEMRDQTYRKLY